MRSVKRSVWALAVALGLFCGNAHAWFFFFIPGAALNKVGDALTGAEGDSCVSEKAKVGDVLTSNAGNTATVKSLSGTSSRCRDSNLPIRALLEFHYTFASKAGIDLPDSFKPKELTSIQRFNGTLLNAHDDNRNIGVYVTARPRKPGTDGGTFARNISTKMLETVEDGKTSNEEELSINGLHGYRFELTGKSKGMFGQHFTYVVTVLENANEYVVVNANCKSDHFDEYAAELRHFAFDVKGLSDEKVANPTGEPAPSVPTEATSNQTALPPVATAPSAAAQTSTTKPAEQSGSAIQQISVAVSPGAPVPTDSSPGSAGVARATSPQAVTILPSQNLESTAVADKLRTLNDLLRQGLITKDDFEAKKQDLLRGL